MIAAILDVGTLAKVTVYALISGVGISVVFALGPAWPTHSATGGRSPVPCGG